MRLSLSLVACLGAWLLGCVLLGCVPSTQRTTAHVGDLEVVTLRRDYANAHVLRCGGHAVLVDSGLAENAAALARDLDEAGIAPGSIAAIVLTHGHADHAGGAHWLHERYGIPIVAGRADEAMLAAGHDDPLCPTDDTARGRVAADQAETFPSTVADVWVDDTLDLEPLTGVPARVVALPGHTPGSLVVIAGQAAIVGDLFRGTVFGNDADRHFYMCDLADNDRDVRTLLDTLAPAATTFFVGHFGPVARDRVEARFAAP